MTEKRLYKPHELAARLGMGREKLRLWRKAPGFPPPVRGKFYDIKAVEAYLDKLSGLKPESETDYFKIFERDLHGEGQGGLSH